MKILVTGANGQVGQEIFRIKNNFPSMDFLFTDKSTLDITNKTEVLKCFEEFRPEICINCAAYTQVDKAESETELAYNVNVNGPENLAVASARNNTLMIHLSTDYVYHPLNDLVNIEDGPCSPNGVYATTKLNGEKVIEKNANSYIIIRTSWVYSCFGNNFVKTMLRLGKEKGSLNVVNDQIGSPTYAWDIANAIMDIVKFINNHPPFDQYNGVYNFSNAGFTHWADFAKTIFEFENLPIKINPIPSSDYPTPAPRPLNSRLSKSKITSTFNLSLIHWKRSLKKCLEEIHN